MTAEAAVALKRERRLADGRLHLSGADGVRLDLAGCASRSRSALARGELPRRHLGAVLAAALLHASVFALLARASGRAPNLPTSVAMVRLVPPPALPAAPATTHASRPAPSRPVARRHVVPRKSAPVAEVADVAPAPAPPPAPAPDPAGAASGDLADVAGVAGGAAAGSPAGVASSISPVDGDPSARVDFDASMVAPRFLSGPEIRYTPEAIAREVEGPLIVRCVVTVQGSVHGCRVLRSLPFMDSAVVSALERRRYAPATFQGHPLDVNYTFKVRLVMPR